MAEQVVFARRVVIGMDGSSNSHDAFEWFIKNVHKPNDYVIIGYCPHMSGGILAQSGARSSPVDGIMNTNTQQVSKAVSAAQEAARIVQSTLQEKLKHSGAKGCVRILTGSNAGHALVKEAEKEKATLLVIGSRGHGAVRRTIMGSVSNYIMHHSHTPVLCHPHIHHHGHQKDKKAAKAAAKPPSKAPAKAPAWA